MKRIQQNSKLCIKPHNYYSGDGSYVLFYTTNPSFGVKIAEVDSEEYMELSWDNLKQMGNGFLQYKVNNPGYANDYTVTTDYYIDTNITVDDNITIEEVVEVVKKSAIEKVDKAIADKVASVDNEVDKVKEQIKQHQLQSDNLITSQLNSLGDKLPTIDAEGYVEEYNTTTHTHQKTTKNLKGDKGDDGYLRQVTHGTTDTTFALTPNTMHVWDEVETLTLTLSPNTKEGALAEYCFQFTSPSVPTKLKLPDYIKWQAPLLVVSNCIYQVSITNNLAVWGEWNA